MTSLPGGYTPTYDANGNVLNDSFHSYTWDAYGRSLTIDSVSLAYDAFGRMVEQNRSGVYTQIVYAPTGEKLALMNGQTLQKAFVPLTGGATAVYTASGLSYYRHSDWLGSSRLASTPTRTIYSTTAYAPFGEPYAQSGTADLSFTGQNQDTAGGSYDFLAREYAIQGRWPSPDPAGLAAVNLGNPQSLNRYAYALNLPTGLVDPLGLASCKRDDTCDDKYGRYDHFNDAVGSSGCSVNGFASSCGMAFQLMGMGMAARCPQNDCTNVMLRDGVFYNWIGGGAINMQQACQGSLNNCSVSQVTYNYFWRIAPADDPWIIFGDGGSSNSTLDARANALAGAINATGVQSLGNPCTVGAFYTASAIGGVIGGAATGGEAATQGVEAATTYWPQALSQGYNWLYRQTLKGGSVANFFLNLPKNYNKAKAAVVGACNAMQ